MEENKIEDYIKNIKTLSYNQLHELAAMLRDVVIDSVGQTGGHLASNLGAVELTIALHRVFNLPEDKLIFDVSHQSYIHKILSGRLNEIKTLRKLGGLSGFQLRSESEYDPFGGGHSGVSISAALGFAEANKIVMGNTSNHFAIAVVGDGSFTNGMIYEALNNASKKNLRLVIVINDNKMSISRNVGGISRYLNRLRTSSEYYKLKRRLKRSVTRLRLLGKPIEYISTKIKDLVKRMVWSPNLFESIGVNYIGPVDGHDLKRVETVLKEAKLNSGATVVHICTVKGKGYEKAEESPSLYHSVSCFDRESGDINGGKNELGFSDYFGSLLTALAEKNDKIAAVTAAMCDGTGLDKFKELYSRRFFDVGIAEEHAVTFAAGLAAAGFKPFVAIYSNFLQRSFDQIIHDVSIQNLPVVFAIDRSGFVSGDGVTHQGIFDCNFLLSVPYVSVYVPEDYNDFDEMIRLAAKETSPVAIRYPKGGAADYDRSSFVNSENLKYCDFENASSNKTVCLITYGRLTKNLIIAAKKLSEKFTARVICVKKLKPFDYEEFITLCEGADYLFFAEEQIKTGSFSEKTVAMFAQMSVLMPKIHIAAVDESFPTHATLDELYDIYNLTGQKIYERIVTDFEDIQ